MPECLCFNSLQMLTRNKSKANAEIKVELNYKDAEKLQFRTVALFLRELTKKLLQMYKLNVHLNAWISQKIMINQCSEFLNSISRLRHECPCILNLDQQNSRICFPGETLSILYL